MQVVKLTNKVSRVIVDSKEANVFYITKLSKTAMYQIFQKAEILGFANTKQEALKIVQTLAV
jgi:hypothetical protein